MWLKNSQDTSVEDVKVSGEVRGDLLEFDLPVEGRSGVIDIYGMALARTYKMQKRHLGKLLAALQST